VDPSHVRKTIEQMNQQLAAEGKAPFQLKTIPQGAATSAWTAVVAPADEIGGHYCENCHVDNIVPDDVPITAIREGVRGYARSEQCWGALEEKRRTSGRILLAFLTRRNGMIEQTRFAGIGETRLLPDPISQVGTSNHSSCPSQYDSDEHREKSESP
jgi:hypothetical protein